MLVACAGLAFPARADGLNAGATDKVALDVPADVAVTSVATLGALGVRQLLADRDRERFHAWESTRLG